MFEGTIIALKRCAQKLMLCRREKLAGQMAGPLPFSKTLDVLPFSKTLDVLIASRSCVFDKTVRHTLQLNIKNVSKVREMPRKTAQRKSCWANYYPKY
jgi:hypothetical protein